MKFLNRRNFAITAGAIAAAMAASPSVAQNTWPIGKTITIIVPFTAAGSNDAIARIIANELTQSLKTSVVVENRPGAGGMLGAGIVARAAPDGYTLMLGSSSLNIGIALKQSLPFDGRKDLTPIAQAASGPMMVVAANKLAASTPTELIALAKANPGKLTGGNTGMGSVPHMGMALFGLAAGIDILHVPYKGGAPVLNDMMGGSIDLYLGSMPQVLPLVRANKVKAIGITSPERHPLVPEIPTIASAVPGFSFDLWWGVYGPGGMPKDVVTRLNTEIVKALKSPAMLKFAETEGVVPSTLTADQFSRVYFKELQNWEAVGKNAKVVLE